MEKVRIALEPDHHRDKRVVKIQFGWNTGLQQKLRALAGLRWSKTLQCWYVPYRPGIQDEVSELMRDYGIVDYSALKHPAWSAPRPVKKKPAPQAEDSAAALEQVQQFRNWMRSRRYSESTVAAYSEALRIFFRHFSNKPAAEIDNEDLIKFNGFVS